MNTVNSKLITFFDIITNGYKNSKKFSFHLYRYISYYIKRFNDASLYCLKKNEVLINQDTLLLINKYNSIIKKKPPFEDLIIDIKKYKEFFSNKDYVRSFLKRLTQFSSVYLFDDIDIVTTNSELYNHLDDSPDDLLDIILMYTFSLDWGLIQ